MGPPPSEPAPRSQSEVNTGRPWGWTGAGSCRGRVGVTGRRRAGERARGDGRADKVSESARPRRRSAHGGKLKPLLEAGKAAAGRAPPSLSPPHEGGPVSAAAAQLSVPRPISSLWPTRLPSPPPAQPVPARGSWGSGLRLEAQLQGRYTSTPSLRGNVSFWASGRSLTPAPA